MTGTSDTSKSTDFSLQSEEGLEDPRPIDSLSLLLWVLGSTVGWMLLPLLVFRLPRFKSNGQRIYFTATNDSGGRITYTGGPGMNLPLPCVNCHGPEGHGGRCTIMMQTFEVPNITWPELSGQHMDHPPYIEETVKRAIIQGIDPTGEELERFMPRWQMSEQDLNDLAGHIETLR